MGCEWKINDLPFQLTSEIIFHINATPINHNSCPTSDKLIWNLTNNGKFTTKPTYHFIFNISQKQPSHLTQTSTPNSLWIWKTACHHREISFLWQAYRQSLPTNINLFKIMCISNPLCSLCNLN